ncbi:hypothetical protein GCM10027403_20210 [Arthrobacter tecti]
MKAPQGPVIEEALAQPGSVALDLNEFDPVGLDSEESFFLPADLSALSTPELLRLCDQTFEELDTVSPKHTVRENYWLLTEELDRRRADDSGKVGSPSGGRLY